MCIGVVGGVKGIEHQYKTIINEKGFKCKLFNQKVPDFDKKIKNADCIIMLTGTVSHKLSCEVCKLCKKNKITLYRKHSSGANSIREVLEDMEIVN